MYHGDESGHLILFVNGDIIQIAFNQTESRTFSFLIEHQLIEFDLEKEGETYSYVVTPQKPPDFTRPERTFDKHFWIPLILLLLILNLTFYIFKFSGWIN